MNSPSKDDRNSKFSTKEVSEILVEIEHIHRELKRTASVTISEDLSNRLKKVEQKLSNLETLIGGIVPGNALARLNDLMELIITSRIRADLESNLHALQMLQSYLHDDLKSAWTPMPSSGTQEEEAKQMSVHSSSGDDRRDTEDRNSEKALDRILIHASPEDRDIVSKLSRRKKETLYHLLMGVGNREISEKLGISEKTVKNTLSTIYKIFQIKSRTQLIHRLTNPLTEKSIV